MKYKEYSPKMTKKEFTSWVNDSLNDAISEQNRDIIKLFKGTTTIIKHKKVK